MPQARIYSIIFILVIATTCANNRAGQTSQQSPLQPAQNVSNQANSEKNNSILADSLPPLDDEQKRALDKVLAKDVQQFLETAEEFELMSVGKAGKDAERIDVGDFSPYPITGKRVINDAELRKQILNSLYNGIASAKSSSMCFYPHHAIRAKNKGKKLEIVICFECLLFKGKTPEGKKLYGRISTSPEEFFNRLLKDADMQPHHN